MWKWRKRNETPSWKRRWTCGSAGRRFHAVNKHRILSWFSPSAASRESLSSVLFFLTACWLTIAWLLSSVVFVFAANQWRFLFKDHYFKLTFNILLLYPRWKHVGECFLAMYRHQTTCEPPRPSLGRRIDLSEYRDQNFLQNLPQPSSPVSMGQTTVLSSSPSSSLPPVVLPEPAVLPQPSIQPQITPSHTTVEVTTSAPPAG